MQGALKHAREHGGKLLRRNNGGWGEPMFGPSTVEALVARGRMVYTGWLEGDTRLPIEATVAAFGLPTSNSTQPEDDREISTLE